MSAGFVLTGIGGEKLREIITAGKIPEITMERDTDGDWILKVTLGKWNEEARKIRSELVAYFLHRRGVEMTPKELQDRKQDPTVLYLMGENDPSNSWFTVFSESSNDAPGALDLIKHRLENLDDELEINWYGEDDRQYQELVDLDEGEDE